MVYQGPGWQRRIAAAESANRLLDEAGVDQNRQIDVFGLCEDLGLWLVFLPLDNLLGAYIPEGVGGVMITTARPVSVQRFTAAHELGHWRMDHGHGLALDGAEHIFGRSPLEGEQLAQFFAANLLMPPPLVYGVLERSAIAGSAVLPDHVYAVAREAGVSYEAAARQLRNLDVITGADLTDLLKVRPIKVKAGLALGRRPVNGYADVWPVNEQWSDQVLSLRVEDEVVVSLPENRTTGYRWMSPGQPPHGEPTPPIGSLTDTTPLRPLRMADHQIGHGEPNGKATRDAAPTWPTTGTNQPADTALMPTGGVQVVGDEYIAAHDASVAEGRRLTPAQRRDRRRQLIASSTQPSSELVRHYGQQPVGAAGRRLIGLRFPFPGASTVTLEYRSPFDSAPAAARYMLHALVEARHTRFSVDQVAHEGDEGWTEAARQRKLTRQPSPLPDDSADEGWRAENGSAEDGTGGGELDA
jgi:Zn-dependent peptidase ImmA (M78 family)/predicted secreted protein